jgi:hypothetical protein
MRAFPSAVAGPWERLSFHRFAATFFSVISGFLTNDTGTSEGQWLVPNGWLGARSQPTAFCLLPENLQGAAAGD